MATMDEYIAHFDRHASWTLLRFPQEDEEGFIKFVVAQYRPTKIVRKQDGVIVYDSKSGGR